MTGDGGCAFDDMLCLHGEVPVQQYQETHRSRSRRYVRGIIEGNGDPPEGRHLGQPFNRVR